MGYFQPGKKVPDAADLNALLEKQRMGKFKVARLQEVDVPKAAEVFELQVSGLGCHATAIETRDVLSKLPGVIRVHPNGLSGKALVFVKEKGALTEATAKAAFEATKELRLRKFEKAKA